MAKHDIYRVSRCRWECRRCHVLWICDKEDAPPTDSEPKDWQLEGQDGECYASKLGEEVDRGD